MSQSAKILIVDDTLSSRILLGDVLELNGYSVLSAASGQEALKILESEEPDLILLDVLMPEMNGYELCRKVRENPALQTVPVIMMTGLDPSQEKTKGCEAGATDMIVKPIRLADLLERLHFLNMTNKEERSTGAEDQEGL